MTEYLLLFGSAFLAATILPFYSEGLLYWYLLQGRPVGWLLLWATLGNTLGAVVNWWLGLYLARFQQRRWFYFKPAQIERARQWYQRFGIWSLLFAWLPVGGDALTLIAGVMRVRFWPFVILVGLGKLGRYVFVVAVQQGLQ